MSQWLDSNNPESPNFNGLLAQLEAEWKRRAWKLDSLNNYVMMADSDDDDDAGGGDDSSDDDDAGDDDDSSDDDDDDDDDDSGDGKGKKDDDKLDPKVKKLSDENAKWRNRFKSEKKAREDLEARLEKLEGKDKPDPDQLKAKVDELTAEGAEKDKVIGKLSIKIAVRDGMAEHNLNPKKAKAIEKLVADSDDIDIDDDGDVTGVDDALASIAEDYPEWVMSDSDDDSGNGNKNSGQRPSGKSTNGKRRNKDGLDKASLEAKFPALRR